jgi:hypothetical protein
MKLRDGKSPMWQLSLNTNVEELAKSLYDHRDKYHHDMFIGDMWEFASNLEMSQRLNRYNSRKKSEQESDSDSDSEDAQ